MKLPFLTFRKLRIFAGSCIGFMIVNSPSAIAQQVDNSDADAEESITLSPFTVESSQEVGYQANSTLAGTRIKTKLSNLSNSITVATKEFMDDLDVTDATNLLPYLGNIETSGADGGFAGVNIGNTIQLSSVNRDPSNNNRVRGLARADNSRNYMPTGVVFDSYNVDRVTVNRGPNSILFGLGAPGGIIDNTTISPMLKNRNKVKVSAGSFGSVRYSFDFDRVLIEDKLGLRVAALNERKKWRQSHTFEDDERFTAALVFKPFKNANLKVSYEQGDVDARRPRPNAPRDAFTRWWDPAFSQVTHSPAEDEFGTIDRDIVRAPGEWFGQPGLIYYDDASPAPRLNYAWETIRVNGNRFRAFTVGITKGDQWYPSNTAAAQGVQFGSFYGDEEILDRSTFDWVENLLDGPNKREWESFDVLNASYDQSWNYKLGSVGFEASYMQEDLQRNWFDLFNGGRGYNINIDINTTLNSGEVNPNFGRPFIAAGNQRQQNDFDREVKRGTAFFEADFKRADSKILGILGRHTGTVFAQEYQIVSSSLNGRNMVDADYLLASANSTNFNSGVAQARTQVYLGPSLFGANSAANANIPGIQRELITPTSSGYYFDEGSASWVSAPVSIGDVRDNTTFYNQIYGQSQNRQVTESQAYIHQLYLLNQEWIVGTFGYRKDEVTSYGATASRNSLNLIDLDSRALNSDPSGDPFEATTRSYGVVMHVPEFVPMPGGTSLSFHWGESENFQISAPRINVFGEMIPPPQGTTEDYGFTLGLLDNKFSVKFNVYESVAGNVSFGYPGFLFETDRRIVRYNTQAERDALNWQGPPDFYKALTGWNIVDGANTISGQNVEQSGTNFSLQDTQSTLSKGKEIDLIYNPTNNWRISMNVAQQEAKRSDIGPATVRYLDYRLAEWTSEPASNLIADESDQAVNVRVYDTLLNGLNSSLAREGQLVSELREWRYNVITNYLFDNDSRFKGFNVGGAFRWEDVKAVGYPITLQNVDGQQLALPDLGNPYTDDAIEKVDLWIGYRQRIMNDRVDWRLQLNVRNVFSDGEIITTAVQPDGRARSVTWREGRTFNLRSTFLF
ncbi:MAG: hypothetical protein SynsKO_13160 [Synoicihabitans sp.]